MGLNQPNVLEYSPDHRFSLLLLGPPRILINGEPAPIDRHKAIALLAYLAITGVEHHRDMLAEMLWPEFDRSKARAALRRALASLTHVIPGDWWEINRESLRFYDNPEAFSFDVRTFRDLLFACPSHDHPDGDMCKECLDPLTAAVQLFQGDFMEGFTLNDCPGFDEWQRHQGEALHRDLAGAIERLVRCHASRKEYETAIRYGKRWVQIDPLDEQSRLALMQLYLQAGQGNAALREYEGYARLLLAELGVSPQGEIIKLYESIKVERRAAMTVSPAALKKTPSILGAPVHSSRSPAKLKNDRMIGRESEMELAGAVWQRTLQGNPAVLVVSGEPGIGKSLLVRELKHHITMHGGQALEGACYQDGSLPYSCFGLIVMEGLSRFRSQNNQPDLPGYILADLACLAPEIQTIYPNIAANPRLDPPSEQQRIFDSFFFFCEAAMQTWQSPLLIVLEDIHWADAGSLRLLRHLAYRARVEQLKLLIVATYRDTEIDLEGGGVLPELLAELNRNGLSESCPLQPLYLEQTRDLIRVIFGAENEIVEGLAEAIQDQTEGNPFFVEEVCRALNEEGRLHEHFEAGRLVEDIRIPASIREVILGRVKHLSDAAQSVLLQAAFLGRQFDATALFGLCNLDDETLTSALEEAGQARLVNETNTSEGPRMIFAHNLIPLALRENISGLRRRREHQRVADFLAIQAPEDISALAYHYAAAENRPKAIEYSQRAARKAMEMNAYEDALKHLRTVLGLLNHSAPAEVRLSILEDYGDVYRLIGEGNQAVAVYQEAQDVWRSLPHRERWTGVRLQRKVGETVTNLNQHADVQRLASISRAGLEAGLTSIKDEPPHSEKVRLLAALSREAWYMRSHIDSAAAENYATRAVEIAEALGQPVEISIALEALAAVYGLQGKLRERIELCQRRLELSFDPRFMNLKERVNIFLQTGMALYDVGEYLLALEHLREAESLGRQIWDIPKQADALVRQAQCLFRLDHWDDLLAIEKQIRDLQNRFTYKRMGVLTCFYYAIQSAVYTWRGETARGGQLKDEAHEVMLSIAGPEQNWLRNQHY